MMMPATSNFLKKSKGKIDAVVAMAMALFQARVHPVEETSPYDERGVMVIEL
jgi:phage terminase large subunit-like protein